MNLHEIYPKKEKKKTYKHSVKISDIIPNKTHSDNIHEYINKNKCKKYNWIPDDYYTISQQVRDSVKFNVIDKIRYDTWGFGAMFVIAELENGFHAVLNPRISDQFIEIKEIRI